MYSVNKQYQNIVESLIPIAMKSTVAQKHSAAVVRGNTVLALGFNKHANLTQTATIHAEMNALYRVPKQLRRRMDTYDVFIIRVKQVNSNCFVLKNSKPCMHCLQSLLDRRIRRIFYSDENGSICVEQTSRISTTHVSLGFRTKNQCNLE